MTRRSMILWVAGMAAALSSAPAQEDGKYRPSRLPGVQEAYLTPIFASSHAANLLPLKNGDLICVWFSGTEEGASDVAIVLSRLPKGSSQWTRPQVVDHRVGVSFQNPVPFEAPDGRLWVFHTTQAAGQGQANANVLVTQSRDGGNHWSEPEVLFDLPGAFTRQPLVVMPNGDWMLPMYVTPTRGITKGAQAHYSLVKISSDRGAHWKDCPIPESNGYVQPSVVREGKQYQAFFRSRYADFIYQSTSEDGCIWAPPHKTELPNNNASIQVARLSNGHLVLVFNNVGSVIRGGQPKAGPRKPLSVALSKDNGATWGWVRDLETGATGPTTAAGPNGKSTAREEYSYPSVKQSKDGKVTVAYTYQRHTIKVVRFDEKWIEDGGTTGVFKGAH